MDPAAVARRAEARERHENDADLRRLAIEALRKSILEDPALMDSEIVEEARTLCDSPLLVQFLRAKGFDVHKSLTCVRGYCKFRQQAGWSFPLVREDFKSELESDIYKSAGVARDGSRLLIMRMRRMNIGEDSSVETYQAAGYWFLFDLLKRDVEVAGKHGLTFIIDMAGFSLLSWIRYVKVKDIKLGVGMLQDAMPMRIRSLVFLRQPLWMNVVFRSIFPFISTESVMHTRLHLFGGDVGALSSLAIPANFYGLIDGMNEVEQDKNVT